MGTGRWPMKCVQTLPALAKHSMLLSACFPLAFLPITRHWRRSANFFAIDPGSTQAKQLVEGLGYDVDYRELRACDYGAPTIRKRFFMVMRCDGCPIQWPVVTHGDPKSLEVQSGRLMPWRTARNVSTGMFRLCPSSTAKPLAENTLKRIARGIQRFVIEKVRRRLS